MYVCCFLQACSTLPAYFFIFLNINLLRVDLAMQASVLSPKAFLGPHRLLFLFICLSRAGKEEATAGRQGHGGRRGPGRLKILPRLQCPWKKGFLLERGLGLCCSPPARPRLKVGGRWCFLRGVWAGAPSHRAAMESALLRGQVEDSSGSTQKG